MQYSDDESTHDEPLFDKSPTAKTFLLLMNTLETYLDHSCVLMMGAGVMNFHYQGCLDFGQLETVEMEPGNGK